jgi:hypothetical protein
MKYIEGTPEEIKEFNSQSQENEQARIRVKSEDSISQDITSTALKSKSNKRDGSSPDNFSNSTFYEILDEYRRDVEVFYEKGVYSLTDRNLLHHCILNLKDKLKQENKSKGQTCGCGKVIATGEIFSDVFNIDDNLQCGDVWCGKQHLCQDCRNQDKGVKQND